MVEHLPFEQTWPVGHTLPQPPQLLGSLVVSLQTPLHRISGFVQAQVPFWQLVPPVQLVPHPPQLVGSICSFTHEAPHCMRPAPHIIMHVPFEQALPMPQLTLHLPQLSGSFCRS
jgi:hypothetical protein